MYMPTSKQNLHKLNTSLCIFANLQTELIQINVCMHTKEQNLYKAYKSWCIQIHTAVLVSTVKCCYNAVQYIMILLLAIQ